MPLIDSFIRVAARFQFNGTGAGADPLTWTPPALAANPGSLFILVIQPVIWNHKGNAFTANMNPLPAGWTTMPGSGGFSIGVVQGVAPPIAAITWGNGGQPTWDIVDIAILEYQAGKLPMTRQSTLSQNSPGALAGAAAGFGNNLDELLGCGVGQNDAHDPSESGGWILSATGGGFVADVSMTGGSPATMMLFGRRPYTTAGGSTATTFSVASPTLQAVEGASWLMQSCGAAGPIDGGGQCQANGAFAPAPPPPPARAAGGARRPAVIEM